jgi:hypothetical protein
MALREMSEQGRIPTRDAPARKAYLPASWATCREAANTPPLTGGANAQKAEQAHDLHRLAYGLSDNPRVTELPPAGFDAHLRALMHGSTIADPNAHVKEFSRASTK